LKFINDENKKYNNVNEKQYQNNVRTNLKTDVWYFYNLSVPIMKTTQWIKK